MLLATVTFNILCQFVWNDDNYEMYCNLHLFHNCDKLREKSNF